MILFPDNDHGRAAWIRALRQVMGVEIILHKIVSHAV